MLCRTAPQQIPVSVGPDVLLCGRMAGEIWVLNFSLLNDDTLCI